MLGLKPRDRVAFEIGENEVKLVPVRFTLESAYGSVPSPGEPQDFKKISRRVKEARAEAIDHAEKMRFIEEYFFTLRDDERKNEIYRYDSHIFYVTAQDTGLG